MKRFLLVVFLLTALIISACSQSGLVTLTVMTHDSFAASQSVITAFEQANNVKVVFLKSGDAGVALNKAILTKDAPLADVFYGVDNTFLSRALNAGIYQPYASPLLSKIPSEFKLDPSDLALPVDYGDICINYDKAYFSEHALAGPGFTGGFAQPGVQGPAGRREPCHLFARSGLPVGYRQAFWPGWLPRLLALPACQRRGCGRWLGNSLLHQLQRFIRAWPAAVGGIVWH